jgi:hypothetical protein
MFPLLPFAVGLITGAASVRLLRNEKTKKQLAKAQDRLREATVTSLNAIETSSARLRTRLDQPVEAAPPATEAPRRPAAARKKSGAAATKGVAKRGAKTNTVDVGGEA